MYVHWLILCACFVISCDRPAPKSAPTSDAGSTASQGYIDGVNKDLKVLKQDLQVEMTGREGAVDKQIGQ